MLPTFEYRRATTVAEALSLFSEKPNTYYLAGGTDLLPQMRTGRRHAQRLIDIKRIAALQEIRKTDLGLHIGASVTLATVIAHAAIQEGYPALYACTESVGAFALRHRATLIGNICNASPAADTSLALLLLDAVVRAVSLHGERQIALADFFRGPGKSALAEGELITEILLPAAQSGAKASYQRLSRRHGMDLATIGLLVTYKNGAYRVGLGAAAPTTLRLVEVEKILNAGTSDEDLTAAADLACRLASPISDLRGSAEYRRDMAGVLLRRAVLALTRS